MRYPSLPAAMQTKLLRVLEDRMVRPVGSTREVPVDIRVVAATNRDLATEVRAGRFRQDLFYRLDVVRITIPPLRERREDVKLLVAHFMAQLSSRLGVAPIPLDRDTIVRMATHDWPGNIRELRNLVERALILGYFPTDAFGTLPPPPALSGERKGLDEVERQHILGVLAACSGNKSEAARQLGVSRKTIERKCAQWGVAGV
jgi:DNA-binding NtrC family response regulator